MEQKKLFPQIEGLMHGCDYNPEQWLDRPDILEEDLRMMKKAGINSVTLGVFSWSMYEPEEGEYHLDWMEEIMDRLYANGIYTILATPSGARPAWLDEKYPEAMRVNAQGQRAHHGVRHNHCMSSLVYRKKVEEIDSLLARRLGKHPGLLLWHISNEFGGACYCPACVRKFQVYLAEKFDHDIQKLNGAWWNTFWSHNYNSFSQIEPPFSNGEGSIMGLNLEWQRFTTWNTTDFLRFEKKILKDITPTVPVTTNFMKLYNGLDYRVLAKELDIISWDSYPRYHNGDETLWDTEMENAFDHAVMRGMQKDKPFMLMESVPGAVNWHPFNKQKRPGMHRLAALQAVACGADTVQYFQWRKGRGGFEQYHGAVVDHLGTEDTRIFREVAETGKMLKSLAPVAGSLVKGQAALIFDWDNRWAIQDMKGLGESTKCYEKTCLDFWKTLQKMGITTDVISQDEDFSPYKLVVAPMLYLLHPKTSARLKQFTEQGGQLLATYLTGYVDENTLCYLGGFPGDGLSDVFGLISEEIDTLYPGETNSMVPTAEGLYRLPGFQGTVLEYAEMLRVKGAQTLALYGEDYYKGSPALTVHQLGLGRAYYLGARVTPADLRIILENIVRDCGMDVRRMPEGVEYYERQGEKEKYAFYLNASPFPVEISGCHGKILEREENCTGQLKLDAMEGVALAVHEEEGRQSEC